MAFFIFGLALLVSLFSIVTSVMVLTVLLDVAFVGHDLSTTNKAAKKVAEILRTYGKDKGVLYDLGSCRGDFLLKLSLRCNQLKAFGVDSRSFRVRLSSFKSAILFRKAHFTKGDLFKANISGADVVYLYLDQAMVTDLQNKLSKELKPGSLVITNTQHLPSWQLDKSFITHLKKPEFEKMFVYIKY